MSTTLRVLSPCPPQKIKSLGVNTYQSNSRPYDDALRLSDQDRSDAIAALGHAMGEGRIDMGEKVIINIRAFFDGHRPPDRVLPNRV